jgi:hypothetical protein
MSPQPGSSVHETPVSPTGVSSLSELTLTARLLAVAGGGS